ncbi:iron-containing redox enzyme family protein [Trinickia mobilis]|uniref:iron-containing redox enzyme family protein n=1 Tax=Trinickia mobilis TaxID=2816356 RepID=UPI001A8F5B01|nr:iron-containing redox enzyme family protein [Trinickia mobilis]
MNNKKQTAFGERPPTPIDDQSTVQCNTFRVQKALNEFYLREIGHPAAFLHAPSEGEYRKVWKLEADWNAFEESRIQDFDLPKSHLDFEEWYFGLFRRHRHEVSEFFDFLANEASLVELAFYIGMEEQVDGRFDDVIALAQLGMSGDMKLALAENYWDEMGLGKEAEMHTVLFRNSASFLREALCGADMASLVPAAALKNGNLLMMYALRRQYSARLLGSLAILEHTAPYRFQKTVTGLERVGVPEDVIHYHRLHIEVDANHGKQLFKRVLLPLVSEHHASLPEVCRGCLIRYQVAVDYYKSLTAAMRDTVIF